MPADPTALPAGAAGACQDQRRRFGAFYTPDHAVAHMVGLLDRLDEASRILEPSGGDGAFVSGLLDDGRVTADQIEVWDLDPAVADPLRAAGVTFEQRDSLLDPPPPGSRVFTHAIGNPPYLNKQSNYVKTHRDRLRRAYAPIGANDTYAMFTYMTLGQLAENGQLVFLVSDTFLTLGVYRKLREHLLATARIDSITLLPAKTFPDAAVRTAILNLTKTPAPAGHEAVVRDLRGCRPGDYTGGGTHSVPQAEFAQNPGSVFTFTSEARAVLAVQRRCPPLLDLLDGGLGMFTRDNGKSLGVVRYPDDQTGHTLVPAADRLPVIDDVNVDGTSWRHYHKRGGSTRWWGPAEHCVRWDPTSREPYGIPATSLAGVDTAGHPRAGFLVSGVSTRLTARVGTPGALWESNKVFGFFPKDPDRWPVTFFVAVFNSAWMDTCVHALNHTVSLQIRDLAALPLLPFTPAEVADLARWGAGAVDHVRRGIPGEPSQQARIDALVASVAARAAAA